MIGALKATPTICVPQQDCVATLIGKASSESEGAGRGGVVPRIVLVVGVGVCVRITDGINELPVHVSMIASLTMQYEDPRSVLHDLILCIV